MNVSPLYLHVCTYIIIKTIICKVSVTSSLNNNNNNNNNTFVLCIPCNVVILLFDFAILKVDMHNALI